MTHRIFKSNKSSNYLSDILSGLKQIFYAPISSVVIILVMTFSLFLATFFYLIWDSNDRIYDHWNKSAEIYLYLKKKVSLETASSLVEKLHQDSVIAKVELIQPSEGMKAFTKSAAGLNTLLSNIKENPLPNVIIIYPQIKILSKNAALELIQKLENHEGIATIKADMNWLERSYNWLNLWDNLSLVLILVLILNAFFVICGVSYTATKIYILKNNIPKPIIAYQLAWLCLVGSSLAVLLVRSLAITLQNQDILIPSMDRGLGIFVIFGSLLLGFISSRIVQVKNN